VIEHIKRRKIFIEDNYTTTHSAYSKSFSWVAMPIGEPVGPSRNFVCGFCGGIGTNSEACKLNFGAAQVITRNGVCKGTNTSFCHPLFVSVIQNRITTFSWVHTVHNTWKALKMPFFSKTRSRNMAETCAIDFSYPTSCSTSIPIGGLSALLLPFLMWAGPTLKISQSAVFAFFPIFDRPLQKK